MEKIVRSYLYAHLERQVAFNPLEPEPFDIVDLTKDVTNLTRIYHLRTECVREALAGAALIVADSPALATAVRSALPNVALTVLPFGVAPIHPKSWHSGRPMVGLLNHSGDVEMNNRYALPMLGNLDRELLIYGRALPGIEGEVTEDFADFCRRCDVLLLPSLPGVINSTTLPLALMASGAAVMAHNAPGYYNLDAASGVQLLPHDPEEWRTYLVRLETRPSVLQAMQERNGVYARKINQDSLARLNPALEYAALHSPATVAGDCGCSRKSAPTEPTQETEPILDKEQ